MGTTAASHNDGATVSQSNPVLANRIVVDGTAALSPAGQPISLRDDLQVVNGGQITPTGLNGSAVIVGGSFLAKGTNGVHVNLQATAAWTLTVASTPLTTANASYVDVKNCTATGGQTIQADHSTDAGSNSGWNFSPSANRPVTSVMIRTNQTLAAATHTLELRGLASTLTLLVDGTLIDTVLGASLNQTGTKHGVVSYYDGSYQQCPVDNFYLPNPSAAPDAPTGLSATVGGLVTWNLVTGATQYSLERSAHNANAFSVIVTQAGVSYQEDLSLVGGAVDYRVRASNANGYGAYSSLVTQTYPPLTLLKDQFTDTNGVALQSHTMTIGPGWTIGSGTWDISGNTGEKKTTNSTYEVIYADSGQSDVTASLDVQTNGFGNLGVVVRLQDANNYWVAEHNTAVLHLVQVVAGVRNVRASASMSPGANYSISVVCSGTSITASIGATSINFTSSGFQSGLPHEWWTPS